MTGMELKLKRIEARVKAKDVAAEMGVTSGWLSRIESADKMTVTLQARYLKALNALTAVAA